MYMSLNKNAKSNKRNALSLIEIFGDPDLVPRGVNRYNPYLIQEGRRHLKPSNLQLYTKKLKTKRIVDPRRELREKMTMNKYQNSVKRLEQRKNVQSKLKVLSQLRTVFNKHDVPPNVSRKISKIVTDNLKQKQI